MSQRPPDSLPVADSDWPVYLAARVDVLGDEDEGLAKGIDAALIREVE